MTSYVNRSKQYEILKVRNSRAYLERVVAPGQEIVFEAFPDTVVEISTGEFITALLADRIIFLTNLEVQL